MDDKRTDNNTGAPAPEKDRPSRRYLGLKLGVIAAVLLCMTFVSFILPLRPTVSEAEKRELAQFPAFSFESLFSGRYFSEIGAWYSDTVPFRDFFTDLSSRLHHWLGTGTALSGFNEGVQGDEIPDIPTPGETDTMPSAEPVPSETAEPVTEAPTEEPTAEMQRLSNIMIYGNAGYEYYNFVQAASEKYASAVNRAAELFAGKANVYAMIVPNSTGVMLPDEVQASISSSDQAKAIAYMEALMGPTVRRVSVFDTLKAHKNEYIYFRTDHHWTGLGAYYAYVKFCEAKGVAPVQLNDCEYRAFDDFRGSFYTDSGSAPALGDTPDVVETFLPRVNADITITDMSGVTFTGPVIYDETNNSTYNKYGAYIWGDNPFSVIENHSVPAGESCLLIKESYGNAIAPLLIYNYKYVYVMDYRYCDSTAAQLVDTYGITDVLYCNNISMTRADSQVSLLLRKTG